MSESAIQVPDLPAIPKNGWAEQVPLNVLWDHAVLSGYRAAIELGLAPAKVPWDISDDDIRRVFFQFKSPEFPYDDRAVAVVIRIVRAVLAIHPNA